MVISFNMRWQSSNQQTIIRNKASGTDFLYCRHDSVNIPALAISLSSLTPKLRFLFGIPIARLGSLSIIVKT